MLNAGYEPLNIVDWQKAMILWLQDKVEVLEFHELKVSSASRCFRLPSVLKLKRYIRPYQAYNVRLSRQNIFLRDQHTCQYCCIQLPVKQLTLDHVLPASRGGPATWENLTTACSDCNYKKGNKTPEEAKMQILRQPYKPDWLPSQRETYNLDRFPISWRNFLRSA